MCMSHCDVEVDDASQRRCAECCCCFCCCFLLYVRLTLCLFFRRGYGPFICLLLTALTVDCGAAVSINSRFEKHDMANDI